MKFFDYLLQDSNSSIIFVLYKTINNMKIALTPGPVGNILDKAKSIVYKMGEQDDQRQYGEFKESFSKIAQIASILCGKEISSLDVAKIQIAHKLVRESNSHKEDNLVDLCGYTAILNDLHDENEKTID